MIEKERYCALLRGEDTTRTVLQLCSVGPSGFVLFSLPLNNIVQIDGMVLQLL